jgi:hypothetical protein
MKIQEIPVYVASRASVPERSAMWRKMRDEDGWNITSTWIDEAGPGETEDFAELWTRIEKEIRASAGVILYASQSDFPLKGAFVEAGIAIGVRKPVAVVLADCVLDGPTMRPLGSWACHPLCRICDNFAEALAFISWR